MDAGLDSGLDAGFADAAGGGDAAADDAGAEDAAAGADVGADAGADASDAGPQETQVLFPRTGIDARELAVLINDDDPQSVRVGEYYAAARSIPAANVIHLSFDTGATLSRADFADAYALMESELPPGIQGLALTWTQPYRVDCMSVTSAFALGFDERFCNTSGMTCGTTAPSDLYRSGSTRPFDEHGIRPAMMLAGASAEDVEALIDRGALSDGTLPMGEGFLVRTTDNARSVRYTTFEALPEAWDGLSLTYVDNSEGEGSNLIREETDVLFYFTGLARVGDIDTNTYLPGAVADHLTSFGGRVPTAGGQMSVAAWLQAGVTGSYGTVIEPCNYQQKFTRVPVFLARYFRGASLLEAYWDSVEWPGEGLFVGDPLARPFEAQRVVVDGEALVLETNALSPADGVWVLEEADDAEGPWTTLMEYRAENLDRQSIRVETSAPFLRLRRPE